MGQHLIRVGSNSQNGKRYRARYSDKNQVEHRCIPPGDAFREKERAKEKQEGCLPNGEEDE